MCTVSSYRSYIQLVSFLVLFCWKEASSADSSHPQWNYEDPAAWSTHYPTCKGDYQSPVDIDTSRLFKARMDAISYTDYNVPLKNTKVKNNGHSVMLDAQQMNGKAPTIEGGDLCGKYAFAQLHFHWGDDSQKGSEHTIDGKIFPLEIHLVHYNTRYRDLNEAVHHLDGLAVLGILYKVDNSTSNPSLNAMVEILPKVVKPDATTNTEKSITLKDFLPKDLNDFVRYFGSLTTPGCHQVVKWTVFRQLAGVSESQLKQFRKLQSHDGPLVNNFRPPQSIGTRLIYQPVINPISLPSHGSAATHMPSLYHNIIGMMILSIKFMV